jgi:hypothetical protein
LNFNFGFGCAKYCLFSYWLQLSQLKLRIKQHISQLEFVHYFKHGMGGVLPCFQEHLDENGNCLCPPKNHEHQRSGGGTLV